MKPLPWKPLESKENCNTASCVDETSLGKHFHMWKKYVKLETSETQNRNVGSWIQGANNIFYLWAIDTWNRGFKTELLLLASKLK